MNSHIKAIVAEIDDMDLAKLRAEWRRRYGAPTPLRSEPFMRLLLAWRVQADILGRIDEQTMRALAKKGAPQAEGIGLGIGARLTRSWKGEKIEVVVENEGFRFEDQLFPSLSAAATAIAGSKWNGPRFFGLRNE